MPFLHVSRICISRLTSQNTFFKQEDSTICPAPLPRSTALSKAASMHRSTAMSSKPSALRRRLVSAPEAIEVIQNGRGAADAGVLQDRQQQG